MFINLSFRLFNTLTSPFFPNLCEVFILLVFTCAILKPLSTMIIFVYIYTFFFRDIINEEYDYCHSKRQLPGAYQQFPETAAMVYIDNRGTRWFRPWFLRHGYQQSQSLKVEPRSYSSVLPPEIEVSSRLTQHQPLCRPLSFTPPSPANPTLLRTYYYPPVPPPPSPVSLSHQLRVTEATGSYYQRPKRVSSTRKDPILVPSVQPSPVFNSEVDTTIDKEIKLKKFRFRFRARQREHEL